MTSARLHRKPGHHVLAIERILRAERPHVGQRPVGGRSAALRIDDPNEPHAGLKVFADLVEDVPRPIVGRQHLDGQVGGEVGESFRKLLVAEPALGDETDVRKAHVPSRHPEPCVGVEDVPELLPFHEAVKTGGEPDADLPVTRPCRARANLPIDELVLPPVPGRPEPLVFFERRSR
jgi:hypothetical protein